MKFGGCIIGLGNPGKKYARQRHNVGFMVLDRLRDQAAGRPGTSIEPIRSFRISADLWTWTWAPGEQPWLVAQPSTFMNRSGLAAAAICRRYGLAPDNLLLVHDELDLPVGRARFKQGGGLAGHNGLKSVAESLGTRDFIRLRCGIGRPDSGQPVAEYVLASFRPDELNAVREMLDLAAAGLLQFVERGIQAAMNQVHASTSS